MKDTNEKKLYDMMNWADVEEIEYTESSNPERILGFSKAPGGLLLQAYYPGAVLVKVCYVSQNKKLDMYKMDDEGFFALFFPKGKIFEYYFEVTDEKGEKRTEPGLYQYTDLFPNNIIKKFEDGVLYDAYKYFGAHYVHLNSHAKQYELDFEAKYKKPSGKNDFSYGTYFAIWAPKAMRVSVIGDFNDYNPSLYQMMKLGDSGIFELFIPGVYPNAEYKYEIKLNSVNTLIIDDPFTFVSNNENSVVTYNYAAVDDNHHNEFKWKDAGFNVKKSKQDKPIIIYELHPYTFLNEYDISSYKHLAQILGELLPKLNVTHILLTPIMDFYDENSIGYMTFNYFEVYKRLGDSYDFKWFVNYLHTKGISVMTNISLTYFPKDKSILSSIEEVCPYSVQDNVMKHHPFVNAYNFDFSNPCVRSFLNSVIRYWIMEFHVDGFCFNSLETALFLDHGRREESWSPNIYGGNINLDACSFFKDLNSRIHNLYPGFITIGQDSRGYLGLTSTDTEEGLEFDYKWNDDFKKNIFEYIKTDMFYRKGRHELITRNTLYLYTEKYLLPLDHSLTNPDISLKELIPGNREQKDAQFKLLYAYMMLMPGIKLSFMGNEYGSSVPWNPLKRISHDETLNMVKNNTGIYNFITDINKLYLTNEALFKDEFDPSGFEWISELDSDHAIITFVRKDSKENNILFIIFNFLPVLYENFMAGVPSDGTYVEIFNSDYSLYGGTDHVNDKSIAAKAISFDGKEYSINVKVPPLSVIVFSKQ